MVVNEWIFHDIRGENGHDRQELVERFLKGFIESADQIAVLPNTRWTDKAWQLWEEHDTRVQILSKLLYLGILIDPKKCRYLRAEEVTPLPGDLAVQVPADDAYLFQTAIAGNVPVIVTSDGRLIDTVTNAGHYGIQLHHRDEFVQRYVSV